MDYFLNNYNLVWFNLNFVIDFRVIHYLFLIVQFLLVNCYQNLLSFFISDLRFLILSDPTTFKVFNFNFIFHFSHHLKNNHNSVFLFYQYLIIFLVIFLLFKYFLIMVNKFSIKFQIIYFLINNHHFMYLIFFKTFFYFT